MQVFSAVKRVIDFVLKWFCILLLAVMTVMVIWQVIARQVFSAPNPVTEITAQYMFVWLVVLGGAYMFGIREHLAVTILKDKYSPLLNMFIEIVINITLAGLAYIMLTGGVRHTRIQLMTLDAALQIPFGYIFVVVPVGGGLIAFYALYNCFFAVKEYKEAIAAKDSADGDSQ